MDVEGSTATSNTSNRSKALVMRHVMYDLIEEALLSGGVAERYRDPPIDRGDGVLIMIHPVDEVPKNALLATVVPTLRRLIARFNLEHPDRTFRVRAAVHAGEVYYDSHGCFGEGLDVTFRLLDAPQLKSVLKQTSAPLVVVVSDDIYRSLIRHGYGDVDESSFSPDVQVQVAGQRHHGWVQVSGAERRDGSGSPFRARLALDGWMRDKSAG
ncbi:hypothetical protein AB5J62_15140 [Amycolatopsis sp. cg5]|uniref:hypothetical protein n=1 Tax=Amycolatopsis sp. cg5 TaxID=3238802 RepID=UPI0035264AB6